MPVKNHPSIKIRSYIIDNLVVIFFVTFTAAGYIITGGLPLSFFLDNLIERVCRNLCTVLPLIIPVIAGMGLNFAISLGAIAGNLTITFFRYHNMGGMGTLMLCFLTSVPLAVLFGWLNGKYFNRVKGQEMVASLFIGFFFAGVVTLILLTMVGTIIPVTPGNPILRFNNIGVRGVFDIGAPEDGGMRHVLDDLILMPFMWFILIAFLTLLGYIIVKFLIDRRKPGHKAGKPWVLAVKCLVCGAVIIFSIVNIIVNSSLMEVRKIPLATVLFITAVCLFITFISKTKLGQHFRAVGHSQRISEVTGINVDRTRIIATILSVVLAAWGSIIYSQSWGTVFPYSSGNSSFYAIAAILVGGASFSRATIKNALLGTILFHCMTMVSQEFGYKIFRDAGVGEFFRSFIVYSVIAMALGIHGWKTLKAKYKFE